jgi:hypothetical protein
MEMLPDTNLLNGFFVRFTGSSGQTPIITASTSYVPRGTSRQLAKQRAIAFALNWARTLYSLGHYPTSRSASTTLALLQVSPDLSARTIGEQSLPYEILAHHSIILIQIVCTRAKRGRWNWMITGSERGNLKPNAHMVRTLGKSSTPVVRWRENGNPRPKASSSLPKK